MPISKKLSKRIADTSAAASKRYVVWDTELKGFGLRIEVSGSKSYIVRYRPKGGGAAGPKQFVTVGRHGAVTSEQARARARELLGAVAGGADPAAERDRRKGSPTVANVFEEFDRLHISVKLEAIDGHDLQIALPRVRRASMGNAEGRGFVASGCCSTSRKMGSAPNISQSRADYAFCDVSMGMRVRRSTGRYQSDPGCREIRGAAPGALFRHRGA